MASPKKLSRQHFPKIGLAHISLICAGLMWTLPFLYPYHAFPITTFYQEWSAVVLGLCAMPLLAEKRYWQQPEIPRIILLPVGLMLIVLMQSALGKMAYFGQALLVTEYLLWAALLIMLGRCLREQLGLPLLAMVLAAFLLLGAELNALVGVLQHYRWHTFLDGFVVVKTGSAVYGNMAQPNHFADYISLGLISLGLLRAHWRMPVWQVALLAAPLMFVLVLSGSRSSWLYLLCMAGIAFLWQRRERKGGCLRQDRPQGERLAAVQIPSSLRLETDLPALCAPLRGDAAGLTTPHPLQRIADCVPLVNPPAYPLRVEKSCLSLLHYSLALLLGFGLMHLVVQLPWLAVGSAGPAGSAGGATGSVTTMGRLIGEAGGDSIRLYLWREAWLVLAQFPLLGSGFGQFGWQHFQLGPALRDTNIVGLYNNAHNLVMQIAAETGLSGLLVLLVTLALWFRQARGMQRTIYQWWGYSLLAVMAIHSMLEYMLWYSYFIGVAALVLGIFDTTTYRLELRRVGRLSVAAVSLLGALSMSQLWLGYRDMERVSSGHSDHMRETLMALNGQPLLRPYAELFMSSIMEVDADNLADKRALNGRVTRFVPINPVVYRDVLLLALSGEGAAAQLQMERAIWSYPDGFAQASKELRALAREDPAHFATLLEFALQKYEERQRAVHRG